MAEGKVNRESKGPVGFLQGFMAYTSQVAMDPSVDAPFVSLDQRARLAGFTGFASEKLKEFGKTGE